MKHNEQGWAPPASSPAGGSGPQALPSLSHSPELSLQIHEVLLRQHEAGVGADDHGLAVLEVGRLEPPFGQLGKEPEPVGGGGDLVTPPTRPGDPLPPLRSPDSEHKRSDPEPLPLNLPAAGAGQQG